MTVTSCNGVDLLDSRSTVYFVARQGAMINVVANIAWMNFPVSWSADAKPLVSGMKQVTIEALLRSADWTDGRGDALSSVFGIEGNFLVRIGDADRPARPAPAGDGIGQRRQLARSQCRSGASGQ